MRARMRTRVSGESSYPHRRTLLLGAWRQTGASLFEVMVAVLVLAIGILGAAALQISALRYNTSAGHSTQASLIASDALERMRANAAELDRYALAGISGDCRSGAVGSGMATRDLADFAEAVTCRLPDGSGSIAVVDGSATVTISWSDVATVAEGGDTVFVLSSVIR